MICCEEVNEFFGGLVRVWVSSIFEYLLQPTMACLGNDGTCMTNVRIPMQTGADLRESVRMRESASNRDSMKIPSDSLFPNYATPVQTLGAFNL